MAKVKTKIQQYGLKDFFEAFDIEPVEITDKILLELICKASGVCSLQFAFERHPNDLLWNVINCLIVHKEYCYNSVRRLFGYPTVSEEESVRIYNSCTKKDDKRHQAVFDAGSYVNEVYTQIMEDDWIENLLEE